MSGPIVCVCGLHGGAGTTTIAIALARHAAANAGRGRVLLCETDPCGGGLAQALDTHSDHGLAELAALRALGAQPAGAPFIELVDGLRLTAGVAAERDPAPVEAVVDVLHEAAAAHSAVVVDVGILRELHHYGALPAASAVVWTTASTTSMTVIAHALAGPLARAWRTMPWLLAVSDIRGDGARDTLVALRETVPLARRIVLAPLLARLAPDDDRRALLGAELLGGLAA